MLPRICTLARPTMSRRTYSTPVPKDRKYTKTHEWVKIEGNIGIVGITDHAQAELGDVVFVELPEPGRVIKQSEAFGAVESVKAASDLYLPVNGTVVSSNGDLGTSPGLVNTSCYEEGWMVKVELADVKEVEALLSAEDYEALLKE